MNSTLFDDLETNIRMLRSNFRTYSNKILKRNEKCDKYNKQYSTFKTKPELILLNIGGVKYSISKELLFSNSSFNFKKIIEDSIGSDKETREIFIDRPGVNFTIILNYLRTGIVEVGNYAVQKRSEILEECIYYGVSI